MNASVYDVIQYTYQFVCKQLTHVDLIGEQRILECGVQMQIKYYKTQLSRSHVHPIYS